MNPGKNNELDQRKLKEVSVITGISLGVFLFLLFFQPFNLGAFDFNNKLLIIAGLGFVVFIVMTTVHLIFESLKHKKTGWPYNERYSRYLEDIVIFILIALSFIFYLAYVGRAEISFHLAFKVLLLSMAPSAIFNVYFLLNRLRNQNETQQQTIPAENQKPEKMEKKGEVEITFHAENGSDTIVLKAKNIAAIKSADNYIEIIYFENAQYHRKMIRNTMQNIQYLLKPHGIFLRCHRTSIINILMVDKLSHQYGNYMLHLKNYNETIPVSRQYLLKTKEVLDLKRGQ